MTPPSASDSDSRDAGQLFGLSKSIGGPILRFLWDLRVEGLENLPAQGPAIIAPNHTSVIDSFFLPVSLPRRITFVGKAEYMDDWKTKYVFPAMGMIPIDRSGGKSSTSALDAAAKVLERGEFFGIYPEGTRSRSGDLHKGHTGVARLALRTGAPIVPVGLRGTREIQPPDVAAPRPFRTAEITLGEPIVVRHLTERAADPVLCREITDRVMFEIRGLSGQRYVHEYAGKKDTPTAPSPTDSGPLAPRRSSADVLARTT